MSAFDSELIDTAKLLLAREPKKRGRLPEARVRRAISTAYYALFHFLIDEATRRIAGADNFLAGRRRVLGRSFSHAGLRTTFSKIRGAQIDPSIDEFLRGANAPPGPMASPAFARNMANVLIDAISKREDADYNRNEFLSEADARILILRIETAIMDWRGADQASDRDFKHALFMLLLLKGQLRSSP